jgi:hypothetical protein
VGFVSFKMLIIEVVLNVAARESFGGLVVVFDMIGAQALTGVVDVDVIVRDEEISLATLRALSRKLGDSALGGGRADLLCGATSRARKNQGETKRD